LLEDLPARNGALHILSKLISPHPKHGLKLEGEEGVYNSWEDWENWLVKWAGED